MATSSIRITKICQWCGVEFEAQKVSTKYCSHRCANLAYKQAVRDKRVRQAETETLSIKLEKPIENVKDKEYLSFAQEGKLLGLSRQAVYNMVKAGNLKASKISSRLSSIRPNLQLYHQHYPSFCLNKHIGKATDNGINLIRCNWLSILADMQSLAVYHFRYLFRPHPSVLTCEAVKYGFFYFHLSILCHEFFNQFFQYFCIQVCNPLFLQQCIFFSILANHKLTLLIIYGCA